MEVGHVLRAVQAVGPTRVVAVIGHQREQVGPHILELVPTAVLAIQETQEGTGHAVRIAMEAAGTTTGTVIVAAGDTPLLEGDSLRAFAVARTMIEIIRHVLANSADYNDLGGDYFERRDTSAETRRDVAALQRLPQTVTINPAAWTIAVGLRRSGAAAPPPPAL